MRFLSRIKNAMISFMYGRHGIDNLYNFITVIVFLLLLVQLFTGSFVLSILCLALICYNMFRVFSKNLVKRQAENMKYLKIKGNIKSKFSLMKAKRRDRKTHVFVKCPYCKNTLRLPKVKGKHGVSCPCCKKSFDVKI